MTKLSKRQVALNKAFIAGYEQDRATFTRLCIESRVARATMLERYRMGQVRYLREHGLIPCDDLLWRVDDSE